MYFLQDDSTESVANSSAAKYYVSDITARSFFTQSIDGTPSADLSGEPLGQFYETDCMTITK